MARPPQGWRSLENGQLPNVKPVKMKERIDQNSTAPMAAEEASKSCHRGEARRYHNPMATAHTPTVTTAGVTAPKRGVVATVGAGASAGGGGAAVVGAAGAGGAPGPVDRPPLGVSVHPPWAGDPAVPPR